MSVTETLIPDYSLPDCNRRVLLTERPEAIPQAGHFAIDEVVPESVPDKHIRVRNVYLSVDPAQRGWAADMNNYSPPVPLGTVMRALGVGVVVESRHPDIAVGDCVYGWLGWQDYAVVSPDQLLYHIGKPRAPLSCYGGILGMNGVTAYLGLTKIGAPKAGETVLVSTAAGAVGSVVGQVARNAGCRTVGLTGSDQKLALCRERFGYDVAINYKSGDLAGRLAAALPEGCNVYFDNVGGTILDTALRNMAVAGRVIQCGTASIASWDPPPTGLRNEREVLTRRLSWQGFVVFDHMADYGLAVEALEKSLLAGELYYEEDIDQGIECAPGAIQALYAGENLGKKLIFIG